jgi:hypothetical protein
MTFGSGAELRCRGLYVHFECSLYVVVDRSLKLRMVDAGGATVDVPPRINENSDWSM